MYSEAAYIGQLAPLPVIPPDVTFRGWHFINAEKIPMQAYRWQLTEGKPKGVVVLVHGYGNHTQWEWFPPSKAGAFHDKYEGSWVDELVRTGFVVLACDLQSHGRSQGSGGYRCYFKSMGNLAQEVHLFVTSTTQQDETLQSLSVFPIGTSMGGCVVLEMCSQNPGFYKGQVLLSPMISLEALNHTKAVCCFRNKDLMDFLSCLVCCFPTTPVASKAKKDMTRASSLESHSDPLKYHGKVRARVAYQTYKHATHMMKNGIKDVHTPFLVMHSVQDNFTDPAGSEALIQGAPASDKQYLKVGPGMDIDADLFHNLTTSDGYAPVLHKAIEWLLGRL